MSQEGTGTMNAIYDDQHDIYDYAPWPWRFVEPPVDDVWRVNGADGLPVAIFHSLRHPVIAHARLIAAAPTLLTACKDALDELCDGEHLCHTPGHRILREAIAEAEGVLR